MPDINGVEQSKFNQSFSSERLNKTEEKDDKNQFLELMIAQLENQNPLDPQDGAQFLSQLAQFSQVDGIERLNESVESMSENFRSSQALQATALVGRQVSISGNRGSLGVDGNLEGAVELPSSRGAVEVGIYTLGGELVRTVSLGPQAGGNAPFTWDGMNESGTRMPQGEYVVVAKATAGENEEQLETQIQANVDSVTLDAGGGVTLNINGASVPLADIKEIN